MKVLERGWLSANNIVFQDAHGATVIDTGYHSRAAQTLALIATALGGQPLTRIINTHLHSDHCGGNSALHAKYGCEILIPPGEAAAVAAWDEAALSYAATGQHCPRFAYSGIVNAGDTFLLENQTWQAIAAPGHDPASLMLHCPESRTLISADALWENGFGVVFPELTGEFGQDRGFDEVAATLDVIASLPVDRVIPGHGAAFTDVAGALQRAHSRLSSFVQNPTKHRWHGVKVLIVFWLMDAQQATQAQLLHGLSRASYIQQMAASLGCASANELLQQALAELVAKGPVRLENGVYFA
jgi:glyoxylase-like metal-dependent hydrolase (beta-lactamase superfamily II)